MFLQEAEEKLQALISKGLNELQSDPAAEDDAESQRARPEFLTMYTSTRPDQEHPREEAPGDVS